jgi:hypothetical protein
MSPSRDLPDIGQVLAPILARVSAEQRPLLIALAERLAADRYRGWAAASSDPQRCERLLACAAREEDIARRVEALYPDAGRVQRDIAERNPDLQDVNRTLFADRPLEEQYTIQARGERLGAATWRSLAKQIPHARETFLACAELEEASAAVLESFLAGGQA